MNQFLSLVAAVVACSPLASAQSDSNVLWTAHGTNSHDGIGHVLHETYDLNGDRIRDFFAISAYADTGGLNNNGLIEARSGADGSVIWRHEGATNGIALGRHIMRPHDINGDEVHDLLIISFDSSTNGLIENGFIRALDGATGVVLWETHGSSDFEWFGYRRANMEDANGNGSWDLLVACPEASTNGLSANGYVCGLNLADGTMIWQTHGSTTNERLGNTFLMGRHLNTDGVRDVVVANPEADTNGYFHNGFVTALSGIDGSQLWRVDGVGNNRMFGQGLNTSNDLDGDGMKDLVINDPDGATGFFFQNGVVEALSGTTGASIWQISGSIFLQRFGASLEFSDDMNGDGVDDIFLGSPDDSSGSLAMNGSIQAIDGASGNIFWSTSGSVSTDMFGAEMHLVGDVDGDGFIDILTANASANTNGLIENGSVALLSANTGAVLWRRDGTVTGHLLGYSVAMPEDELLRDLTGDGAPDVILGAPFLDSGALVNTGEIQLLDGATGATVWMANGTSDDQRLGDILDVEDDLDGDGLVDILSASRYSDAVGYTNNGSVHALAGADGSFLWSHAGGSHDEYFGNARGTIIAFDVDGDGFNELLAGTPLANVSGLVDNGYVTCISGGVALRLECTPLVAGQTATISLDGLTPGATTAFFTSFSGAGYSPIRGRRARLGMSTPQNRHATPADPSGFASFTATVPAGLSGWTIWLQAATMPGHSIEVSRMLVREIQ